MEYYFEVYFDCWPGDPVLVKAKDVIEAGKKAAKMMSDRNGGDWEVRLVEINRTRIFEVIE